MPHHIKGVGRSNLRLFPPLALFKKIKDACDLIEACEWIITAVKYHLVTTFLIGGTTASLFLLLGWDRAFLITAIILAGFVVLDFVTICFAPLIQRRFDYPPSF